ncbi:MAG: saccharopine dehydrogenase NADP-binding domain-containing protein, partial [Bacteroidota bacterium]|nr:saccharopine dehydrogenase NADP-binding domain-containing protein [Bacteroidota bacterium]
MKQVLLFGAGKSATILIDYLLQNAITENWHLTIVDADLQLAESKINASPYARALSFDINQTGERKKTVQSADIVISLLPPQLHFLVAEDCIEFEKNLLTASYIDDDVKS